MSQPSHAPKHPYHLVSPSPWPFVGALGAFVMAFGGVQFMHDEGSVILLVGLGIVIFTMFAWWRDVVLEARTGNTHTKEVRIGLIMGILMFIASEVMFFVAFFWAFFHNALQVNPGITQWPPEGIETLDAWGLPALNTVILISSGITCMWATHGFKNGNRGRLVLGLALSAILGFIFLGLQAIEYGHAAFAFADGIYPSTFYMATGFHGFHVFVGAVFLVVCAVRANRGDFTQERHIGLMAAEWYWHFVDVVWLFLFVWVYWWAGA